MDLRVGERSIATSDMLRAVAGPRQSDVEEAARELYRHLGSRPGWVSLTTAMFPYLMPLGWFDPMVRVNAGSIDVAMKRSNCLLSSDAMTSTVTAIATDILPETLAAAVGGRKATIIYGDVAPFNIVGWVVESAMVRGPRTKIRIRTPALWVPLAS